jgi:signal transduction histidine kinase
MVKRTPHGKCPPRHGHDGTTAVAPRPRSAPATPSSQFTVASRGRSSAALAQSQRKVRKLEQKLTTLQAHHERLLEELAQLQRVERQRAAAQFRQVQAELEARMAERTRELQSTIGDLETFSYSLSHDVRAPLRAIQSYVEVLARLLGEKLGPRERGFVEHILQSTNRLDGLVQDVLDYSRLSRGPMELSRIDLERLVGQVLHDHPALQEPQATLAIASPLLPVRGHESLLSQCLSNLLTNAVKFVRLGLKPQVRLSTRRHSGRVQFWCEDNGIGIAPENQQRIFGLFQRLHSTQQYEGTGIGLAIVQKAVERIGGRVGVQSTLGQGSRFWLDLQAA